MPATSSSRLYEGWKTLLITSNAIRDAKYDSPILGKCAWCCHRMFAQYKAKVNSVCQSQQAEATAALTAQLEEVTTAAAADAALLQQHLLEATESGALATQQLARATQHADANKAKTTALREQLAELLLAKGRSVLAG